MTHVTLEIAKNNLSKFSQSELLQQLTVGNSKRPIQQLSKTKDGKMVLSFLYRTEEIE